MQPPCHADYSLDWLHFQWKYISCSIGVFNNAHELCTLWPCHGPNAHFRQGYALGLYECISTISMSWGHQLP